MVIGMNSDYTLLLFKHFTKKKKISTNQDVYKTFVEKNPAFNLLYMYRKQYELKKITIEDSN